MVQELPIINSVNDQAGTPLNSAAAADEDAVVISIGGIQINNYTSYRFERDFFHPIDTFDLVLEDDDIEQLTVIPFSNGQLIPLSGLTFQFLVNGKCQFNGFVYTAQVNNTRGSGSVLNIHCRNILGVVSDSTLPPQLSFNQTSTYSYIMKTIFADFGFTEDNQFVFEDDSALLSTASGANQSKFPKLGQGSKNPRKKNPQGQLNRLLKPYPNEGVMEFAQKLCHRIGWNIQQYYDGNKIDTIAFVSPVYLRKSYVYEAGILRFKDSSANQGTAIITAEGTTNNFINPIDGNINFDWSHQASIIVGECSMYGGNFYRQDEKFIAVNEISGYNNDGFIRPEVQDIIDSWVTYGGSANNAYMLSLNDGLLGVLSENHWLSPNNLPVNPHARPLFIYDQESATQSELDFAIRRKLYDLQSSFLTLNYTVQGHTTNGVVWQTNTMIGVADEAINTQAVIGLEYWIKKVIMTRSRHEGTKTHLELKLPYIYDFEYGTG